MNLSLKEVWKNGDLRPVQSNTPAGESSNEAFASSGKGYYNLYDKKGLQIMLSNFVRIRKQNGVWWFMLHLFIYTITIPLFLYFNLLAA